MGATQQRGLSPPQQCYEVPECRPGAMALCLSHPSLPFTTAFDKKNLFQSKAQSPQNPYSHRVSALQPWSAGLDRHGGGVFGEGINKKLTLSIQRGSKQCPMPPGPGSRILKSELPQPSQDNPGGIPRIRQGSEPERHHILSDGAGGAKAGMHVGTSLGVRKQPGRRRCCAGDQLLSRGRVCSHPLHRAGSTWKVGGPK